MDTPAALEERTVSQVMTTELLTITPDDSVLMAWELMGKAHVHHLPVVSEGGRFMGVVDAQTLTARWEPTGPERARRPVRSFLPDQATATASPGDLISQAARTMLESGRDHVAVLDDENSLVGLLTARDLISALAGFLPEPARSGTSMPSLYRIEPVLPSHASGRHPGHSMLPPE